MESTHIIIDVLHLPRKFNELGNATIYSLLDDTGYFKIRTQVSEDKICEALHTHPECVDDWLRYSEDKRSDAGWYFQRCDKGYRVGYFSSRGNDIKSTEYTDQVAACACFIKHEIEDIGQQLGNDVSGQTII